MDYLYFLSNASLTLRLVEFLRDREKPAIRFMTAIHRINGWIVKVKFERPLDAQEDGDFRAYLGELGISYEPDMRLRMALWSLETGQSPVEVMRRYQVAVVSHGRPEREDIEVFRQQFTRGLGYCPETLA